MEENQECIFCKIVKEEMQAYKVWEDDNHLAFLSIFPNTKGVTVVIPKKHYSSYAFNLPEEVLSNLILAAKKVAKLLDSKLDDVGRTALVFEGFGIDHVHAKLFPLHGTKDMSKWKPISSKRDNFFDKYPGYVSSHDAGLAKEEDLKKVQEKIIN
jgi:histidine triad (HIT) family protein